MNAWSTARRIAGLFVSVAALIAHSPVQAQFPLASVEQACERIGARLASVGTQMCLEADLRSGDIVHSLTAEGVVEELYDVAVIPDCRMPAALGFKTEEIRRTINLGDGGGL